MGNFLRKWRRLSALQDNSVLNIKFRWTFADFITYTEFEIEILKVARHFYSSKFVSMYCGVKAWIKLFVALKAVWSLIQCLRCCRLSLRHFRSEDYSFESGENSVGTEASLWDHLILTSNVFIGQETEKNEYIYIKFCAFEFQ